MTSEHRRVHGANAGHGVGSRREDRDAFRPHDERARPADERLGGGSVEHVGGSDEVGDEPVRRALVDVAGLADLLDASLVEHREPVAQGQCLVLVVGDDDERDADLALDLLQLDLHLFAQLEIQCAERLVEQQHPGSSDQRARQRHSLTLAARQLRGLSRRLAAQPDHVERVGGALAALVARHALDLQPVLHVLGDGHVGEQGVFLEDGVDVATPRGQRGDVDAAEADRPRRRLLEPGDHAQHRGLARAGRAEDREQLTVADGQVGALDGDHLVPAVAELFADADQLDLRIVNGGSADQRAAAR